MTDKHPGRPPIGEKNMVRVNVYLSEQEKELARQFGEGEGMRMTKHTEEASMDNDNDYYPEDEEMLPCITCGKPNSLTPDEVEEGYQCKECEDSAAMGY